MANSEDPDQTPQNAASDQGLHCLHQIQEFLLNVAIIKTNQTRLILEMDRSEVWWKKSPFGINGLSTPVPVIISANRSKTFPLSEFGFIRTVESQWLEQFWDHRNLFEIWVVRATEG